MSDLLTAAAQALKASEAIVKRSADARAKASGVSADEILSAWAGGGAIPEAPPASPEQAQDAAPTAPTTPAAAVAAPSPPPVEPPAPAPMPARVAVIERPPEEVEPVPLGQRIKLAGRVGAWTGALLGVLGTLIASPWLLPNASLAGTEGDFTPSVLVSSQRFVIATAVLSIVFGLVVAAVSRTLTGWLHPGAASVGKHGTTAFIGACTGLLLGLASGSVLTSAFGAPVEGAEGIVNLSILSAMIVVPLGGALLGWLTAALVQAVGVPAALVEAESEEVATVRSRLGSAIGVPLAGILTLAVLVLPFAVVLIRSNHMASGGAAAVAILTAASILAISGLAASKPGMKISRGEFLVALGGIGVVVLIVVAVLLARSDVAAHEGAPAAGEETTETTTEG